MSLITLPNPSGIDFYVQRQQSRLYAYLTDRWGPDDSTYNSFGRVYRNNTKDGYIPEFYNPATGEYVAGDNENSAGGMFIEDSLAVVSFYGMTDPEGKNTNRDEVAKVSLMFFLDLSQITPGGLLPGNNPGQQQGQRLDELAINDVMNFLQCNGCCFTLTNTYRGIDKVLEQYSGAAKKLALLNNMHPKLCFRIDITITGIEQ